MRQSKNKMLPEVSELVVSYKPQKLKDPISSNSKAYSFFLSIWDRELFDAQEQSYALFLDTQYNLICWRRLGIGSLKQCNINLQLLAAIAVKTFSASVTIAHNHPSGSIQPSSSDKLVTNTVKKALALFDIKLNAHLVITETAYYDVVSGTSSLGELMDTGSLNDSLNSLMELTIAAGLTRFFNVSFCINDSQLAAKVLGESMCPTWVPEAVLALKLLEDKTLLIWGELYMVMHKQRPAIAGRIYESKGGIELLFDNTLYPAIAMKWDDVTSVYRVKASIKKINGTRTAKIISIK